MNEQKIAAAIHQIIEQIEEENDRDIVLTLKGEARGWVNCGIALTVLATGGKITKELLSSIDNAATKRIQDIEDEEGPPMPMLG